MQFERLSKQLEFIVEIDKLKYIKRKTKLFNSDRHENDAEHSWHLAMMVMTLAEHANEEIDMLKVLRMVLIHDLVEIDAGDTFLFDTTKDHDNTAEELVAAKRIFGLLPQDQTTEFLNVWEEFENAETAEAKFAKTIDRFEPILQNMSNGGGTWVEYNVALKSIWEKLKPIKAGSDVIWDYSENLIEQSIASGILKED